MGARTHRAGTAAARTTSWIACALALVSALAAPTPASALDPARRTSQYVHRAWGKAQGLPQVTVQDILQDRQGYLWLASQEGLVRFDGLEFERFDSRTHDAFHSNHVFALAQSADGAIWAGTGGGGLVRHRDGEFTALDGPPGLATAFVLTLEPTADGALWIGTEDGLYRSHDDLVERIGAGGALDGAPVAGLDEAADGTLWIGTRGGGVFRSREGRVTRYEVPPALADAPITAVLSTADGAVWFGTADRGLFRIDGDTVAQHRGAGGPGDDGIESLAEDADGNLWIGTYSQGLRRLTSGRFAPFTTDDGLTHARVTALLEDREGSLWIGTFGGGLNRLRDGRFVGYSVQDGLASDDVWTMLEDPAGGVWVGTETGLERLVDGRAVPFAGRDALQGIEVLSLLVDRDGRLWAGTFGHGLFRRRGDGGWDHVGGEHGLIDDRVYTVAQGADGVLWFGTRGGVGRWDAGVLDGFGVDDGLPHPIVRALHVDAAGTLWVGTHGGGIARLREGRFEPLTAELSVSQRVVYALYGDPDGVLWAGTAGGLLRLRDGEVVAFTARDGLFDDRIFEIVDDGLGNLWMTCNHGVSRVAVADLERFARGAIERVPTTSYGTADGMPASECNGGSHPAGLRDREGRLWFPTVDGLAAIDPRGELRNDVPPPVVIERVEIDGRVHDPGRPAVVRPGTRSFDFAYTALSLVAPEQVRYRTMLVGYDDDWVDTGSHRQVVYRGLDPGAYAFRVIASNEDGTWSDAPAVYRFELQPWFYETALFRVLASLAALMLVMAIHGLRVRRLRHRERELERQVTARTAQLQSMAEELKELSLRDPLTGLRNRRYVVETTADVMTRLGQESARQRDGGAERRGGAHDEVLGLFLLDIDHFKAVNDSRGHDVGDRVLVEVARVLADCARADDLVIRWGGEEFLVVLPRARRDSLAAFAERLRAHVAAAPLAVIDGTPVHCTCSVGYTAYPLFAGAPVPLSLAQLVAVADLGLYRAKASGRNRVVGLEAGPRSPDDDAELARTLGSLEWAVGRGYLVVAEGAGAAGTTAGDEPQRCRTKLRGYEVSMEPWEGAGTGQRPPAEEAIPAAAGEGTEAADEGDRPPLLG